MSDHADLERRVAELESVVRDLRAELEGLATRMSRNDADLLPYRRFGPPPEEIQWTGFNLTEELRQALSRTREQNKEK